MGWTVTITINSDYRVASQLQKQVSCNIIFMYLMINIPVRKFLNDLKVKSKCLDQPNWLLSVNLAFSVPDQPNRLTSVNLAFYVPDQPTVLTNVKVAFYVPDQPTILTSVNVAFYICPRSTQLIWPTSTDGLLSKLGFL